MSGLRTQMSMPEKCHGHGETSVPYAVLWRIVEPGGMCRVGQNHIHMVYSAGK
jgi:hypothetical protein